MDNLTGRTLEGYEVFDRIGSGGFGVVYRAFQSTLGREVAIKIILPGFANRPEFIRRFQVEAQLIARLEHLHIVPLYDFWRDPSGAYLVMRWLKGGNLKAALAGGSFDLESAAVFLDQVASGLSYAHTNGVIHRDVKPANILLDEEGNCYLSDFGIALDFREKESQQANISTHSRHPDYISPEIARNELITTQSDIYSLGVILYEVLTGEHPFPNTSPVERLFRHINDPFPQIENFSPDIREGVNVVIQKATAKNPKHRYQDALEMAAAFREAAKLTGSKPVSIFEDLTVREQEILAQIIAGRTNREIAQERYIELSTVKWYVRQIYRKLGVRSRRQAVVRAKESRLFSKEEGLAKSAELQAESPTPTQAEPINPYKGLRAFEAADAREFFGREALVKKLLSHLTPLKKTLQRNSLFGIGRFLAIVGPSGSGKTSLIKAGLVPALMRGEISGSERWFIAQIEPGARPLDQVEVALVRLAADQAGNLREQLVRDQFGLVRAANLILPNDGSELILFVDQFEELFTLIQSEDERARFLDLLSTAAIEPNSRVRVVIALRADFYDRPLIYPVFGELVRNCLETVLPLAAEELERAILQPAMQVGVNFEPGLVAKIIEDTYYQPGALPMLQYALTELFEHRTDRLLTHSAYQTIGGAGGALANRAEEIYMEMNGEGRKAVRQIFLRLVNISDEDGSMQRPVYTRRRTLRAELLDLADEELIDEIIDTYSRYRLLSLDHEPNTRRPTVEVAHEALLSKWERLRRLLDESREDLYTQRRLGAMAREWEQAGRDPGYLLRGSRLEQFSGWAANSNLTMTGLERSFIRASLLERDSLRAEEEARQKREIETAHKLAETEVLRAEEQVRSARRLRWLALGLAVFLVFAIGAAWYALSQRDIAQNNFITSERVRLAAQAQIALDNGEGGDLPALLALRSLQSGYSAEADAALLSALTRGFTRQRYVGHTDEVLSAEFSPDGRNVLTASADQTVRLWDAQTGEELHRFEGHSAAVNAAIFSPDGRFILSGSHDNTARLWDAQTGQEIRQFTGHTGGVWGVDFTPDGQFIVTSDGDMARLWDVQTGEQVRQFIGHTGPIWWSDISPDGRFLVTCSDDRSARVWDLQSAEEISSFTGHTDWIGGARFSPDSQYVLTSSADRTASLWEAKSGKEVRRFVGHTDALFDGFFSPDGQYVVTSSYDKTARLWDIASGQEVRQFLGHTDYVSPASFSRDSQRILTGSGDRTARMWDIRAETEPRRLLSLAGTHYGNLYSVDISADNRFLLIGRTDGMVQVREADNGKLIQEISFGAVTVNAQAIAPDDRYVLTGDAEGIVRLGDILTGEVVRQFVGHTRPVLDVLLFADGKKFLTASEDGTTRLWDLETGQEVGRLNGHNGPVRSLALSPDGHLALTGSDDGTARLWELETGQELHQFNNHTGPVLKVAFSPDGRFILTGGNDGTAWLWEVETGEQVRPFIGHTAQITQMAFSPDSRFVLTGSADQTARLWDTATGKEVRRFAGHASPLQFVSFSADGKSVYTSDLQNAYRWRTSIEDVISFACSQLTRDFTEGERELYHIADTSPTCTEFTVRTVELQPTWTPILPGTITAAPLTLRVEFEFLDDVASLTSMGVPVQDVFIDVGDGQVVRPDVLNEETLSLPVYSAANGAEIDLFEAPFDTGPYPKGEPLGFTLGEWLAATGKGIYTLLPGNRARVELAFEKLVPSSVYTVWCNELSFVKATMKEAPCGQLDGSENVFTTDQEGHGQITMEIDAFPPSTEDAIYEFGIAYHSDGKTYGESPGQHGLNAHAQMFYDFMPP